MFLGYKNSYKGYKCLNYYGRIFTSRLVIFNKKVFPFQDGFLNTKISLKILIESQLVSFPLLVVGTTMFSNDNNLDQELEPTNPPKISEEQDRANPFVRVDDLNED